MTIVKLPRRVPEKKTFSLASIICAAALPAAWAQTRPAPALPEKEPDAPVQLTVFEVREDADVGYRATQTLSGSRTAQQLRDIPSSISVQNRALIEDLMVTDIAELSMYNISGEVDVNNESPISSGPSGGTVSRGTSTTNLRDGVVFFVSQDSHNVDRVELLRGPNGFLYTGGGAGGISNPVPKQAMRKKSQSAALIMGSNNLFRAEYDINRPINEQLAFRASLAFQEGGGFQNHTERSFRGLYATLNYRPFASTNINVSADVGRNIAVMAPNMLSDQFSTTDRTGSTVAYSATTGGFTYVPARGLMFDSVGTRRSQGTNLILFDASIVGDKVNMPGPGATNQTEHYAHTLAIDQKVGERLNIQFKGTLQGGIRDIGIKGGSQDASVYRDMSATLPNGQPNQYFGEYYTEFWHGTRHYPEPMRSVRLSVVYDIKTRWMTQRLIGGLHYQSQEPLNEQWAEFVDPASPYFKGSLINANTLEAYRSNRTVLSQNRVNRRFYFRDGDAEHITKRGPIPGQTVMLRDIVTDGADGRTQDRLYWNEGGMIGASGSYFKGRVHTMVGWRQDAFIQDPGKDFYNSVTGEHFRLGETGRLHHRARPESYNYGGVIHIAKFLAAYATYAENVVLTTTAGQPGLLPGTIRAAPKGYGDEYGLRWLFFGDRLESNWTYYKTYRKASASIPANVRSTELGLMVDGLNTDGSDSQDVLAEGSNSKPSPTLLPTGACSGTFPPMTSLPRIATLIPRRRRRSPTKQDSRRP